MWTIRVCRAWPVLPCALQGAGLFRGDGCLYCSHSLACLHQLSRLCSPGSCCWLRAKGRCCWGHAQGCSHSIPKQIGPRVLFIAFLIPLPSQMWDQILPIVPSQVPANETKSPPSCVIPSCPSKYLTAFSKALCVCPGCMFYVGE